MRLRLLTFLVFICAPASAVAQTTVQHTFSIDTVFTWTFDHPNVHDDGVLINCNYPQGNCLTFNQAACNSDIPVQVSVTRGSGAPVSLSALGLTQVNAYAWIQPNQNTCSNSPLGVTSDTNTIDPNSLGGSTNTNFHTIGTAVVNTGSSFAGGSQALTVPDNFTTSSLTVGDIMNFPELGNICNPAYEIAFTFWQLCIGVDGNNSGYINGPVTTTTTTGTSGTDPVGFFRFPVATQPPPQPSSITTVALDSRVQVFVGLDNTAGTLYGLKVLYTDDPGDIALTTNNSDPNITCQDWANAQDTGAQTVAIGSTSGTVTVPGTNNTEYAYCALTVDWVGNPSIPSIIIQDYPHPECGLFDCWPSDVPIDGGYCGASLTPGWFACMGTAWLAWRMRRRRLHRTPS